MPLGFTFRSVAEAESIPARTAPAAPDKAGKLPLNKLFSMIYEVLECFPEASQAIANKLRQLPRDLKVVP